MRKWALEPIYRSQWRAPSVNYYYIYAQPPLNTPKVTGFVFIFCSLKHIQRTSEGQYFMILEVSERHSLWIRNKSEKSAKFCLILGQILWNMKPWNLKFESLICNLCMIPYLTLVGKICSVWVQTSILWSLVRSGHTYRTILCKECLNSTLSFGPHPSTMTTELFG
jgi:hypothetical protein